MTKGTHLLRSALLALLALAVISGGSLATGDLFDENYSDCPHRTRLRDGQIADLTVARDAEEEDEVNVSWAVTDASAWGLGPNAYNASLVVILDDGTLHTKALALGSTKTTFDGIKTGKTVEVQLAIVVSHLDDDYLISDILETSINQSLTEPAFTTGWQRVTATTDADATAAGFQFTTEAVAGTMYYVGHNENFGNYRTTDADFVTVPATPRLRIGLAHSANETNGERDDVDFEAYVIRIEDEGGDRVFPHDVTTVASSYGTADWDHDSQASTPALKVPHKLFLYDLSSALTFNAGPTPAKGTLGTGGYALVNVRVHDGGDITVPMHVSSAVTGRDGTLEPDNLPLTMVKVGWFSGTALAVGDVFAEPPDEHRDLPNDIFKSDGTYTITAWAVNDDDEIISPVTTLKVRPVDTVHGAIAGFRDYKLTSGVALTDLVSTEYTVLK